MNIIIVGGSLGGLFAGVALKRLGHNVHILERNHEPLLQDLGAGIVAGQEIRAYMKAFDDAQREFVVESVFRRYLDIHGDEICREMWPQCMTSWGLLYYILLSNFDGVKNEFCQVLSQANCKTVYDYGASVTDMKVEHGEVTVFYEQEKKKKSIRGDILIAADGASSSIRMLLCPDLERQYAGYVAWRGTILESEASELLASTLVERFTFYHAPGTQILSYVIPGKNDTLKQGDRLINWVWYCNYEDLSTVHTDCDGQTHRWSLAPKKVNAKIWENQKRCASENLPLQFIELINKTQSPFVQAITDVLANRAVYCDGRVVLVGDALAGFRPHTGASTSQPAFHASKLYENMKNWDEWVRKQNLYEESVMEFARHGSKVGKELGNVSQFGHYEIGGKIIMVPPSIR